MQILLCKHLLVSATDCNATVWWAEGGGAYGWMTSRL